MTNPTIDYRAAWEDYAQIWKLSGAEAKRAACEKRLRSDCVYTDPLTRCEGWDALIEYMQEFHRTVPGGHFVTTEFKAHHGRSLAHWNMVGGDGTILGTGASYAEYTPEGHLVAMTGFFEANA